MKGKSCLTKRIATYDNEMTGCEQAFDAVSHNIFIGKQMKYEGVR